MIRINLIDGAVMGKKLCEMTLQELWRLFPISLVPHRECWAEYYAQEKSALEKKLPLGSSIYHIGSTAVKNIMAKNIVDILVELPWKENMHTLADSLTDGGYTVMSSSQSRVSLCKGYTEEGFADRVFHLHLRRFGDCREIIFRDRLNLDPAVAKEYEALKLKLWKEYEFDRDGYTQAKSDFVERYSGEARALNLLNTPEIRTERLILRRFNNNDVEGILRLYGDSEVNRFLPWLPLEDISQAESYLYEKIIPCYDGEASYNYAIEYAQNGELVGYVHLHDIGGANDLGYAIAKEYWGKGIATEACRAVIDRLAEDGLPFVIATHDVENPRSGEVMKRLGMKYAYSYNERWQPKDIDVVFKMYQLNLDGNEERIYSGYRTTYDDKI